MRLTPRAWVTTIGGAAAFGSLALSVACGLSLEGTGQQATAVGDGAAADDGAMTEPNGDGATTPSNDADAGGVALDGAGSDASRYAQAVLASAPIAYYRLGDTAGPAVDALGKLPGTYGSMTMQGGAAGLIADDPDRATLLPNAAAASYDASYVVSVPRASALEPTGAVTVECWIKPNVITAGLTFQELISYGDDRVSPYQSWVLQLHGPNIEMFTRNTATLTTGKTALVAMTTYYVAGTYDAASGVMQVYLNGVLDASLNTATGAALTYDAIHGLGLGGGVTGANPLDGVLDEIAIYDRVLSANEVASHYAVGNP